MATYMFRRYKEYEDTKNLNHSFAVDVMLLDSLQMRSPLNTRKTIQVFLEHRIRGPSSIIGHLSKVMHHLRTIWFPSTCFSVIPRKGRQPEKLIAIRRGHSLTIIISLYFWWHSSLCLCWWTQRVRMGKEIFHQTLRQSQ